MKSFSASSSIVLASLCVVFLFFVVVGAQECVKIDNEIHRDDLCYNYYQHVSRQKSVDSPRTLLFYLAPNTTTKDLIHQMRLSTEGLKLVPQPCFKYLLALTCSGVLLPCAYQKPNELTPIYPRAPCKDTCDKVAEKCQSYFASVNSAAPNCTLLPEKVKYNATTGIVPCNEVTADEVNPTSPYPCPAPLTYYEHANPKCGFPCPSPLFDEDEYTAFQLIRGVLAAISLVCSIFVSITYGINPKLRKMPGAVVFWIAFMTVIYDIGTLLSLSNISETMCRSPVENARGSDAMCGFSSFASYAVGVAVAFYLFFLALNLLAMLAFDYRAGWVSVIVGQCIAIGFPFISWIVLMSIDQIESAGYLCFISGTDSKWYSIVLYTIPINIIAALSLLVIIPLMYLIIKTKLDIRNSLSRKKRWWSCVRVFIYVMWYWGIVVWLSIDSGISIGQSDDIANGIEQWLLCSLSLGNDCKRYRVQPNLPDAYAISIAGLLTGPVILLCFGFSDESIKWWKMIFNGELQISSSTTFKTRSHSSSSGGGSSKEKQFSSVNKA